MVQTCRRHGLQQLKHAQVLTKVRQMHMEDVQQLPDKLYKEDDKSKR